MTMRFDDVIVRASISAPKCLQTGNLLVVIRRWQNAWLFLSKKLIMLNLVSQTLRPLGRLQCA